MTEDKNKSTPNPISIDPVIVRNPYNIDNIGLFMVSRRLKDVRVFSNKVKLTDGTYKDNFYKAGEKGKPYPFTTLEREIIYILNKLYYEQGYDASGVIYFSIYEILDSLKMTKSQRNYEWLREKLMELTKNKIEYNDSYKRKDGSYSPTLDYISIFDNLHFGDINYIAYHPVFLQTILAPHHTLIRLDVFQLLETNTEKNMFAVISQAFPGVKTGEIYHKNLFDFATVSGVGMDKKTRDIIKQVEDAIPALHGKETTSGVILDPFIDKNYIDASHYVFKCLKGPLPAKSLVNISSPVKPDDIINMLTPAQLEELDADFIKFKESDQCVNELKFLSYDKSKISYFNGLRRKFAQAIYDRDINKDKGK